MCKRTHCDVCSVKHAAWLDTRVRRLVQNPDTIMSRFVEKGQKVLDIGCGPGYFSLAMARIVGDEGLVIAADLQQEMLDRLHKHALAQKLESRIRLHKCTNDRIGLDETVDFALVFYMIHEVPDQEAFIREVYSIVKPGGGMLLVEPKIYVSDSDFHSTIDLAGSIGFKPIVEPKIWFSRSMLFKRS